MDPIVVETKLDYAQVKRQYKFHCRKNIVGIIFNFFFIAVLVGLLLALNVLYARQIVVPIFSFVLVFVLLVSYIIQMTGLSYSARQHKQRYGNGEILFEYTFYPEIIECTTTETGLKSKTTMEYSALCEVCETRDAYYLFLTPMRVYIVDKAGFKSGTVSQLSALLKEKLGDEYERFGV